MVVNGRLSKTFADAFNIWPHAVIVASMKGVIVDGNLSGALVDTLTTWTLTIRTNIRADGGIVLVICRKGNILLHGQH